MPQIEHPGAAERGGRRADLAALAAILVLGLLSLTWFRGAQFISAGDFAYALDGGLFLENTLYVWDGDIGAGHSDSRQVAFLVPYALLAGAFHKAGLGQAALERVLFYLWFAGSGAAAYFLCRRSRARSWPSLAGGLFYMMSFYAMSVAWHLGSGMLLPAYAAFPALLALFMAVCDRGFRPGDVCGLVLLWALLGPYMYVNPALLVVHWTPLGLYLLLRLARPGGFSRRRLAVGFAAMLVVFLLANAQFVIPLVQDLAGQFKSAQHAGQGFISDRQTLLLNSAPLAEQLATRGVWDVLGEYRDTPFHDWGRTFAGPLHMAFGFVLLGVALLALAGAQPGLGYFGLLLVAGLYLAKGALPPFGGLLEWVYGRIPFLMSAFRASIQKWGMLAPLAMAPLLAHGVARVAGEGPGPASRLRRLALALLAVGFAALYAWPYADGSLILSGSPRFPGPRFSVPADYARLRALDSRLRDASRILSLPLTRNGNAAYVWQGKTEQDFAGYSGGDFIRWEVDRPVVFLAQNPVERELVEAMLPAGRPLAGTPLLALLRMENVGYVLLHKDWYWDFWKNHPWQYAMDEAAPQDFLRRAGLAEPLWSGEDLALYRLPAQAVLPRIFCPKTLAAAVPQEP